MSEADNYPELDKKTDIADHETNSSPSEEINNQELEVMDTDFEQQPVSETVVNDEENAEPSKADTTEPQTENNELNSVVESLQKEIESLKQELELKEEQVKVLPVSLCA